MQYFQEPKTPSDDDRYSFTIDELWLDGETISSVAWSVESGSSLTTSIENITLNVVSALFSSGVDGRWCVTAKVNTATRDKDFCGVLTVRSCC